MRCVRCNGCLHMEHDTETNEYIPYCINCGARLYRPIEELTTPMREHGKCLCGNEIRSDRLDVCPSCHCARIKQGRLAAAQERMAL